MKKLCFLFSLMFALLLSFTLPIGMAHAAGHPSGTRLTTSPSSVSSGCDINPQIDRAGFVACAVESYATPCLRVHSQTSSAILACVPPGTILHLGCWVRIPTSTVFGDDVWETTEEFGGGEVSDYYMATANTANNSPQSLGECGGG